MEKVRILLNIKFDTEPVYGDNDEYIKTKIKIYGDKVNTNFQGKKIPQESTAYKCLSLIMLYPVVRVNKKYYAQTLLEECKYEIKKTKLDNLANDDLESSSSDNEAESDSAMSLIKNLNLIMRLTMNLTRNNLLINIRIKTVF